MSEESTIEKNKKLNAEDVGEGKKRWLMSRRGKSFVDKCMQKQYEKRLTGRPKESIKIWFDEY